MLRKVIYILWVLIICHNTQAQHLPDPEADKSAQVVDGNVRFTILTSHLIRIEYAAKRRFENRASLTFINRKLPLPAFTVNKEKDRLEIQTAALKLEYLRDSGPLDQSNLKIHFTLNGKKKTWKPGMTNSSNLLGTTRTVDGYEGKYRAQDGARLELEQGLLSRDGWSLVDDSDNLLFTDNASGKWVSPRASSEIQDWYFFAYGHDYKKTLGDFTKVAGKIPLPPRYAFGYWWSRYWVYSDSELRDLVKTIKDYDIPLDVLIIDMDWHETYRLTSRNPDPTPFDGMLGWTGYTWNRSLFPDPEKFLRWTDDENLKVALNLHPSDGIAPFESGYPAMLQSIGNKAGGQGWLEYRMSDKIWAKAYFEHLLRQKEEEGIDFWWLDWQQWAESKFVPGLNNTFWLNHVFFSDMERNYPERRPLLFHRWGGLGNHRYQVGFSGDAVISWKSLAYQPYFTATAANVGYGYWSHDIGGHIDKYENLTRDGELYLRWIQFGALSPILRTHASKSDGIERRIWMYPEYFPMMRDAIRLRYGLMPYLYTAGRQAYDTGVSIARPMYYDYSDREQAYHSPQQYMLGNKMIVSPVTTPANKHSKLSTQTVWLPEGGWFEWSTGTLLKGGGRVTRTFSHEEIPLYVKAGSIIPMYTKVDNLQKQPDKMVLTIVPGGTDDTRYYEDAGDDQAIKEANTPGHVLNRNRQKTD